MTLFSAYELGQGEYGSVMKGAWKAPSGELVSNDCMTIIMTTTSLRWSHNSLLIELERYGVKQAFI